MDLAYIRVAVGGVDSHARVEALANALDGMCGSALRIMMIERLKVCFLLPKDVSFDPPRQPGLDLIRCMESCWDAEDVVELSVDTDD